MCRRPVARAAIDNDRLGTHAFDSTRHVDRGVAAAIHHDLAPQHRLVFALHRTQHRDSIDDMRGVASRDRSALADMGTDRKEGRIKAALLHAFFDLLYLCV